MACLQTVMALLNPDPIRRRFQTGRRCFGLKIAGQIISYGWVSRGMEKVGELEREFHFLDDEVYIWDCGTVPELQGNHCYTALLSHLIHQLHGEGVRRVWIGASRLNHPSVQGIRHAGFQQVVDLTYRRYGMLKILRFYVSPEASSAHLSGAYRILLDGEWQLGPFALGLKRAGY